MAFKPKKDPQPPIPASVPTELMDAYRETTQRIDAAYSARNAVIDQMRSHIPVKGGDVFKTKDGQPLKVRRVGLQDDISGKPTWTIMGKGIRVDGTEGYLNVYTHLSLDGSRS